jgi:tetratricopeptide (TPR) repeat protein
VAILAAPHSGRVTRVGATLVGLALCAAAPALAEPPASRPDEEPPTLQAAEAALNAGQLARACELAASIAAPDHAAARARFVEGYARYKLHELDPALRLLQRSLDLEPSSQVSFLAGLVAFELHRWSTAERYLAPLVSSRRAPWAEPAGKLLGRARQQARNEVSSRHSEAIRRARQHLQAGRSAEAAVALAEAERVTPGHLLNRYYRGYLAYQSGDFAVAREQFRAALRTDPNDRWSSYMLALSLEGDSDQARMLVQLAGAPDPAVQAAALRALAATERRATTSAGRLSLLVEVGSGLDTNPAQVTAGSSSSSAPPDRIDRPLPSDQPSQTQTNTQSAALALRGRIDLAYQRQLAPLHLGAVGLRVLEQGFPVGGAGYEQTELSAFLQYTLNAQRLQLSAAYQYTFDLLGHSPLLSLHDFSLSLGVPIRSWIAATGYTGLRYRQVHDDTYRYIEALECFGTLGLRVQWKLLTAHAGYQLLRSWASPVEIAFSQQPDPRGSSIVYQTRYAFLAHGPQLELELALPWRLSLRGAAWFLWHSFDDADRFEVQQTGTVIWQQERRDLRIIAAAELSRPLRYGLELAMVFNSIDNLSSLDSSSRVNRTYSRRTLLLSLRWRWPMR